MFESIPWEKVNYLCHMLILIHVASKNVWAMPKSIYNMGNFTCHVICNFMCDMQYLIRCIFSLICNVSWSIHDISNLLCSMSESIYVVSINPFGCFNSFKTWASTAHSVSVFVELSLLWCICKTMHSRSKLYVAWADSPFDPCSSSELALNCLQTMTKPAWTHAIHFLFANIDEFNIP